MASLKRDVARFHPELKDTLGVFDALAYRWQYHEVFDDFLDFCLRQHLLLPTEGSQEVEARFLKKYSDEEQAQFGQMYQNIALLTRERVNLWAAPDQRSISGWYDPLGSFYEEVSSDGKKSMMGQYFTPQHLCTMMCQITMGDPATDPKMVAREPVTVAEPACGSGRMVLAANAVYPGCMMAANDLDPMCAKMTCINMALNGAVGQVTCGDGLDASGYSFRWGYTVMPLLLGMECLKQAAGAEQEKMNFAESVITMLHPEVRKTYCLVPLKKEDCMIYNIDFSRNLPAQSQEKGITLQDRLRQVDFLR